MKKKIGKELITINVLTLVLTATLLAAQPIDFQVLQPSLTQTNATLFGCGGTITGNKETVVGVGFDMHSSRQFFLKYSRSTDGDYIASDTIFLGDAVNPETWLVANAPNNTYVSVPLCVSENGDWVAFGTPPNPANGYNGNVIVAKRASSSSSTYQLFARLYSNFPLGATHFPAMMVCTRNFSTIYVTERSVGSTAPPFIRNNVFKQLNLGYYLARVEEYINGTASLTAPIALTSDGSTYAVRSNDPNFIYVRKGWDGTVSLTVNLTSLSPFSTETMGLARGGLRLILGDSTFGSSAGRVLSINYNASLGNFDVANAEVLNSSAIPASSTNRLGFMLSVSGNETGSQGVAVGLPGANSELGGVLTWAPSDPPSNSTTWVSSTTLLQPFGPGLASVMRSGGARFSANLLSDDEQVLLIPAPGDGSTSTTGLMFIILNPMPDVPLAPTEPVTPPTPVEQPTAEPPIANSTALQTAAIIIAAVSIAISFSLIVKHFLCGDNDEVDKQL